MIKYHRSQNPNVAAFLLFSTVLPASADQVLTESMRMLELAAFGLFRREQYLPHISL